MVEMCFSLPMILQILQLNRYCLATVIYKHNEGLVGLVSVTSSSKYNNQVSHNIMPITNLLSITDYTLKLANADKDQTRRLTKNAYQKQNGTAYRLQSMFIPIEFLNSFLLVSVLLSWLISLRESQPKLTLAIYL